MRRRARKHRRVGGFTLLEVMATTILLALLTATFYAPNVLSKLQDFQRHQADVVAEELNRVGIAAQRWTLDESVGVGDRWPGGAECLLLFPRLGERAGGFDGFINPKTAFYRAGYMRLPTASSSLNTFELGRYYPSCNNERLRLQIFFDADDGRWGHYIANRLAGAVAVDLGGRYDGVVRLVSDWGRPAAALLSDLGDDIVSKSAPEFTGALRSNLDAGRHAIYGANDVVLSNGHSLGKTIVYAAVVSPGSMIGKPDCAPGLTPQILASFNSLYHSRGHPINYAEVFTEERELDGKPAWKVRTRIIAAPSRYSEYDFGNMRINVLVRCS